MRLPATRTLWRRVILLSLGGFFEFYDLFFTGYIAPGLVRSGILTATTPGLFGTTGIAGFVAAMFSGLFLGTFLFSFLADRFGRRAIFTWSLLWYTVATVVMAFQNDVFGLNLWRFLAGIGVGVELVTIDTFLSELVPKHLRGRAFAYNQTIQFCAVPSSPSSPGCWFHGRHLGSTVGVGLCCLVPWVPCSSGGSAWKFPRAPAGLPMPDALPKPTPS